MRVAILSDSFWRRSYGADPAIVGRDIYLSEEAHRVLGILEPGFEFPIDGHTPDVFTALSRRDYCCGRLGQLDAIGRLRDGVSKEAAQGDMQSIASALGSEFPATNRGRSIAIGDLHDVLNLIKVARTIPYIDANNIFMVGHSRGGMMTYLVLKDGSISGLRAAAVIAGPTDLFAALPRLSHRIHRQADGLARLRAQHDRRRLGGRRRIALDVFLDLGQELPLRETP